MRDRVKKSISEKLGMRTGWLILGYKTRFRTVFNMIYSHGSRDYLCIILCIVTASITPSNVKVKDVKGVFKNRFLILR